MHPISLSLCSANPHLHEDKQAACIIPALARMDRRKKACAFKSKGLSLCVCGCVSRLQCVHGRSTCISLFPLLFHVLRWMEQILIYTN